MREEIASQNGRLFAYIRVSVPDGGYLMPNHLQPQPSGASNAVEIATAFARMSLGPPPVPTTESDEPEGLVGLSVTNAEFVGDADSATVEA